jgi:adenylosuccinate synthase
MNPRVVIGAALGDEGKGATVNALANDKSLVCRFSGGCQSGHTVVHNGKRHVFSSFGAGTLKGARTHMSRFFVVNPLEFLAEYYTLAAIGVTPKVSVSPYCYVTTLCDVGINRALELSRGDKRHGSCGVGFGETIERCENSGFSLCVGNLKDLSVERLVRDICTEWVPYRLKQLGISTSDYLRWAWPLDQDNVINKFVADCQHFLDLVTVRSDKDVLESETRENIIFEGSQGLLLDSEYGTFPYVTRSRTGLTNVLKLIEPPLDVYYVSRAYTTRHGAGPLPHECTDKPYPGIVDNTNIPNEYQGSLRFSYLNLDQIYRAVRRDRDQLRSGCVRGVMTCLDQIDGKTFYHERDMFHGGSKGELLDRYAATIGGVVFDSAGL